ncbi:MAG: EAL domain-containing protein [Nitrospirae bacterium]|nr:EAL domain-containing protein [Nitrospirota bacterium]
MSIPLRVLIVEDSEDDTAFLLRELRRGGYEPAYERVQTLEAMKAAMDRKPWDIIVSDYMMPQFSGLDALKLVREKGLDLPFIIVSATIGEDVAIAAMKTGAHDCIMKYNLKRLSPAVERELREARMRREHAKAEAMIQHMAFYDTLTDLPNRNMIYNRLQDAIGIDGGQGKPMALFVMDLDRFREINDTLGHRRGDFLLRQVGERLQKAMWERDIIARLGGDEFAVLMPRLTQSEDIHVVVRKILSALEAPFPVEDIPIAVEVSLGIALYPEHGTDADTLFQRADIAMYVAKKEGLGHAVYRSDQDRHNPRKLALISELRHAIEHDELVLYYQPTISLKTNRVIGVEALVRWQHPNRGMVPPDQFIGPAEQTGLIHPLTRWVMEAAMRQCREWRRAGVDITASVNLSARNLLDPKLFDRVTELLRVSGGSADWMRLEITESAVMAEPIRAMEVLLRLHETGFRFSIDDFGTGYSSLAYLKKLPVDTIKIERSFVINMPKNANDEVIVRSTVELAHNLGLNVVAEGVENKDVWDRLSAIGCDEAQGYYMGRPLPAVELARWFNESPWGFGKNEPSGRT